MLFDSFWLNWLSMAIPLTLIHGFDLGILAIMAVVVLPWERLGASH